MGAHAVLLGSLILGPGCDLSSSDRGHTADPQGAAGNESPAADSQQGKTAAKEPDSSAVAWTDLEDMPPSAAHPSWSPGADRIVFEAGQAESRDLYELHVEDGRVRQLTDHAADAIHPTYEPGGKRIVFASTRGEGDDFDLYRMTLETGQIEQVTDFEGDELAPDVSPIRYTFEAVVENSCTESGAGATTLDTYRKVAFTRRYDDEQETREEVWFASLAPPNPKDKRASTLDEHAHHRGRISPRGTSCRAPAWSGDGLSMVWSCGPEGKRVVHDLKASWEQSFAAALKAVKGDSKVCEDGEWSADGWEKNPCLKGLPRQYATYEGQAMSKPARDLHEPALSANQIVVMATGEQGVVTRGRMGDSKWAPLEQGTHANQAAWSPAGNAIALVRKEGEGLHRIEPDFYLQTVTNLDDFPELVSTRSDRLAENGFVVRPGDSKEFHALHETLRYRRRPQFITADAALQVYRDEFQHILEKAEKRAADQVRKLSKALMDHFADRYGRTQSSVDRYFARYFATAWIPLHASTLLGDGGFDNRERARTRYHMGSVAMTKEEQKRWEKVSRPVIERIPQKIPEAIRALPRWLRKPVERDVERILDHSGMSKLELPWRDKPVKVDWTQFKARGAYAENDLGDYFLAMMWYAQLPLPSSSAMTRLAEAMHSVKVEGRTALQAWQGIDAVVGAFLGKPVDVTPAQVVALKRERPGLFRPFDAERVHSALADQRGDITIRNLGSAGPSSTERDVRITFFPQRQGLDSTFFSKLTHPRVPERGLASALDVFAALGIRSAGRHAARQVRGKEYAEQYRKMLSKLRSNAPGPKDAYWSTDLYHAWLAALATLAQRHEVPSDSLLKFRQTDAWADRKLHSALGGFTHLKHSATLYAAQDYVVECGSSTPAHVLVEQPVLPQPKGFVDPMPTFFQRLSSLAGRVYDRLHRGEGQAPSVSGFWGDGHGKINVKGLADRLARIARKEVAGKSLSSEDHDWIEMIGRRLEALSLRRSPQTSPKPAPDGQRAKRGIAIATDVQSNPLRNLVRQIALGRIDDLWVVVPGEPGRRLTQGGTLSFYEFTQPLDGRLTDMEWHRRLKSGEASGRPEWIDSFFQDVEVEWRN
jgi:hypothetical protein